MKVLINQIIMTRPEERRPAFVNEGLTVVFVTFMQQDFEKGRFGRILGVSSFVVRPLAAIFPLREREFPAASRIEALRAGGTGVERQVRNWGKGANTDSKVDGATDVGLRIASRKISQLGSSLEVYDDAHEEHFTWFSRRHRVGRRRSGR
jgi:hypothetical protein